MGKVRLDVTVESHHVDWLDAAVTRFSLPDRSKALRCLLAFSEREGDESIIFGKKRCKANSNTAKVPGHFEVEDTQLAWLKTALSTHSLADIDKTVRVVLEYGVVEAESETVFGVIQKRCLCPQDPESTAEVLDSTNDLSEGQTSAVSSLGTREEPLRNYATSSGKQATTLDLWELLRQCFT
ncbi:hypothetical protein CYMTET_12754 [Cymbomonas tetramitiformis]|uniref:Uncharacterized protein n=1 Tax=Cymbomonas tetramitiformis TaxID=36881 RepID=A0AAE0GJY7_9CHLO|nr:hypothetical protein CYMTET_12754 [Cymbomonas tetramitiformis]